MKRILLALFILATFPALGHSTTYYVNKSGSNGNSCSTAQSSTPANGKLTIAAGLSCLGAADTLIIGAGTYAEGIDNGIPSGTDDGHHTIVKSAPSSSVVVTGCNTDGGHVWSIFGRQYITLDGLDLNAASCDHSALVIGAPENVAGSPPSSYILVQNNILRNAFIYTCASFRGGDGAPSDHLIFRNNVIHDCGTTWPTIDTYAGHGIYPTFHQGIVEGNTFYNIGSATRPGTAIHQYSNTCSGKDQNIFRNNIIHDATSTGILVSCGDRTLVYNNVIYSGSIDAGIQTYSGESNAGIYNNTIYGTNAACIWNRSDRSAVIRNNICYRNRVDGVVDDSGGVTQSNNLTTNPSFVNAGGHDFHLALGSAAINYGVALSSIFTTDITGAGRGTSWDAGAYEFGGTTTTPPAPPTNLRRPE